ncbi:hypothetical protein AGMMS49992_17120 [Clostridia bacterium]|nr:hypothetical protein AGMMS49992_17120 [Clostridia bacterium]
MKIPYLGDYTSVYVPQPAIFQGPDSARFSKGTLYSDWVPNDFTIIHDGMRWHLFGITHPYPPDFLHNDPNIHEAEWQLFHAVSPCATLKQIITSGSFMQEAQVLSANDRPGEPHEIWAPIVWRIHDRYIMLYSPDPFRIASSSNLYDWTVIGKAFSCNANGYARDPNIMERDGIFYVIYLTHDGLCLRESNDLLAYGPERLIFKPTGHVSLESPIIKWIDGWYYLFYCIYDHTDTINGAYDYRTFVHAAQSLDELMDAPCIANIKAHAPELFQDEDGDWYIASVEWPKRGVSIAPVTWI